MLQKYKYLKLTLAILLMLMSSLGAGLLQSAGADPLVNCGKGAQPVPPQGSNPGYCTCKDQTQKLDTTSTPEDCVDKCPDGTQQANQNGQTYCNAIPTDSNGCNVNNPPAACTDPALKCSTSNSGQCDFVGKYINPAINTLTVLFGLFATISIILGGINYATSEGDPHKASKAKRRIANTVIAVVAYMFLYAFLQFIVPGGIFH